jgi:short-subunit dehydrogenase
VLKSWSGIDILVNNAGIVCYGPTENISDQQWTELLAVNLTAPITLTSLFLPSLLKRSEAHILNVCSCGPMGNSGNQIAGLYLPARNSLLSQSLQRGVNVWFIVNEVEPRMSTHFSASF